MSRLWELKTGKKKKHSCKLHKITDEVLNQRTGKNQPIKHRKYSNKK